MSFNAMCHCEHEKCHPNGNCPEKATRLVETFGIRQFLCSDCQVHESSVILRTTEVESETGAQEIVG